MIRRSRARFGKNRFKGLPAVFAGIALVVAAAGASAALWRAATALPDLLRESRELWLAVNARRRLEPRTDERRGTIPASANPLGR